MPVLPDSSAGTHLGNYTGFAKYFQFRGHTSSSSSPTLWSLVQGNVDNIVSQAITKANGHLTYASDMMGDFRRRIEEHLQERLTRVQYQPQYETDQGNITASQEIHHDVELAVDYSMHDLNMTDNSTFREELVKTLDTGIDLDSLNTVLSNAGQLGQSHDDRDFFHKMPIKDETLFVVLVCMGTIVPIILITLFAIFFYKRRKNNKERRQEMLLREQPEFSMDEYPRDSRSDEDVPDLDLKGLRT